MWAIVAEDERGILMGHCCLVMEVIDDADDMDFDMFMLDRNTRITLSWPKGYQLHKAGWRRLSINV